MRNWEFCRWQSERPVHSSVKCSGLGMGKSPVDFSATLLIGTRPSYLSRPVLTLVLHRFVCVCVCLNSQKMAFVCTFGHVLLLLTRWHSRFTGCFAIFVSLAWGLRYKQLSRYTVMGLRRGRTFTILPASCTKSATTDKTIWCHKVITSKDLWPSCRYRYCTLLWHFTKKVLRSSLTLSQEAALNIIGSRWQTSCRDNAETPCIATVK